jgi:hypothetical protein
MSPFTQLKLGVNESEAFVTIWHGNNQNKGKIMNKMLHALP